MKIAKEHTTAAVAAISVGDWGRQAPKERVSSAVGSRIKAPRRVGCGEGVSPSPLWEGFDEGAVPPPQRIFRARKGEFWCILGPTFAVEFNGNWLGQWVACSDWWIFFFWGGGTWSMSSPCRNRHPWTAAMANSLTHHDVLAFPCWRAMGRCHYYYFFC